MPIPIAKEDAARSIEEQAFTLEEIYSELTGVNADMLSLVSLGKELQKLVQSGKVRSAVVGGLNYYGIGAAR